jgi:nucleotide-binding universal stress UspA family protein
MHSRCLRATVLDATPPLVEAVVVTTINQIICPVDLSPASASALRHASAWARWYEAPLRVLYVAENPQIIIDGSGETLVYPTCSLAEIRTLVERFVSQALPSEPMPTVTVLEGDPVTTILEEAARWTQALVIMGTHGWTGLDRVLLGSVTERVAHGLACPLLVVPPKEKTGPVAGIDLKRILCAVDFRPSSLAGLRYALSLAQERRARLELVTVLDAPHHRDALALDEEREHRTAMRDALRDRVPNDAREWCVIQEEVLRGSPAEALVTYAGDVLAELLVIGTGDRRHLRALWLGSTTGRLLRSARCPVLIVPAPRRPAFASAKPLARRDWSAELQRVSVTHQGEPATIAIVRDDLGTQREAFGLPFVGVTADVRDGAEEIAVMLAKENGTHLTHVISQPQDVRLHETDDQHDVELVIVGRDGSTTLLDVGGQPA